ncbi:MAG: hypothetical protein ACFCUI_02315 [Bernardetiaceae bacterium]
MEKYYTRLAAAWARGKLMERLASSPLFEKPLQDLTLPEQEELIQMGYQAGMTPYFLQKQPLSPAMLGLFQVLRALQADHLLDVSAQEVEPGFVWPLIDAFPYLPLTVVEVKNRWTPRLKALNHGGIQQLDTKETAAEAMTCFWSNQFDVTTSAYGMDHVSAPEKLMSELLRIAKRYVLLIVSQERWSVEELRQMGAAHALLQFKITPEGDSYLIVARK